LLTNEYNSTESTLTPNAGLVIKKSKINFSFNLGTNLINFDNQAEYLNVNSTLNKQFVLPYVNVYGNYKFTKTKNLWVNYNYNYSLPSARQILPIEDLANPLNTFIGNPDLDLNKSHNLNFNYRNYDYTNLTLAPVNNTRSSNDYFVDGYWSINNKDIFTPSYLRIYPRSLVNRFTGIAATGSSGTNIINIFEQNFDESIMIGVGVSSSVLSAGTAITNIIYNQNSNNYNLYLSSNLTSSGNTTYYFGDNSTRLVKRLNDIHLYLKYYVNDTLNTTYYKLDKSPTWIADWYKKEDWNYNDLDTNQAFDLRSAHNKSDISNFSGLGQTNYFNGVLIGDFISKSSIGTTFDFRITSNGGIKLIINEETSPYISQWKNTTSNSFTASYVAIGASSAINLKIEFCNQENDHFLKAEWRKTGEVSWNDIDSSFYFEPDIAPILVNANKINNLSYLVVGKTQDEISTPTLGFPETDRFTLRNK
jgi:hypothetical protein